jgi:molybdenum cofactor cytidylyltransferase
MNPCAAIILAAGFSSRMEKFKPLLPVGNQTMTDRVISIFRQNEVEVYLVTGWRQDELLAGINSRDITLVLNPDYPQGMFTSVQAGLMALLPGYRSFFVIPVDVPLVKPATISMLLKESEANPERIIYPGFNGKRGHPPLIPVNLIPLILNWKQDGGLKAALGSKEELALNIEVPDSNILFDVDTVEDYQRLEAQDLF